MPEDGGSIRLRNNPASAALRLGIHPTIDARDVFAGYGDDNVNAPRFGNYGLRWLKVYVAHSTIFAIIANISQAIFAIFAIGIFAKIARIAT